MSLCNHAAIAALAAIMGGCSAEPPRNTVQPAFYADLARPGARFDEKTASEIINAYRARNGAGPLVWDAGLEREAQAVAERLAARGDLSDGGGPVPAGMKRSVSGGYHTFADAFSGWRGSPTHDGVLKAPGSRYAIAALSKPGSRHRIYWVMLVK
jgi:uncharacterized protein YkwD